MQAEESFPSKRGDVIWRRMGEESVLLNVESENYYSLNEVGTRVWELIDGQRRGVELARQIAEEYEVSPEEARADVEGLLEELRQAGLLL